MDRRPAVEALIGRCDAPPRHRVASFRMRFVRYASLAVAMLMIVASLGGLLLPAAYVREADSWRVQAVAQDWFDLAIAAPGLAVAAIWAVGRSRRARFVLAGLLLYATYTLLIYAFAVHLNPLFLVYCAGLGLAVYALIALARALEPTEVIEWFAPSAPRRAAGGFLIGVGVAFALLWLLQLLPVVVTGRDPPELAATGLFTNPVHVIDLSFILPLHILAGVLLWRRRPLGYVLAPVVLAFGAIMASSIGFLMIAMELRGVASGTLPMAIAMGGLATATLALASWSLASVRGPWTTDREPTLTVVCEPATADER